MFAGAAILAFYLLKAVKGGAIDKLVKGIGGSLAVGGSGAGYPIGGGQFGPQTAPIASAPAVKAAAPAGSGVTVLQAAVDRWSSIFPGQTITIDQARTLPQAAATGKAPTFTATSTGIDIVRPGDQPGVVGHVAPNQVFLGYAPGTNVAIWG